MDIDIEGVKRTICKSVQLLGYKIANNFADSFINVAQPIIIGFQNTIPPFVQPIGQIEFISNSTKQDLLLDADTVENSRNSRMEILEFFSDKRMNINFYEIDMPNVQTNLEEIECDSEFNCTCLFLDGSIVQ